ncbi:hypothetical protein NL676_004074 [Syzygium grande]|nr:hypothetical protein NL676_004074 [Syzygium grande]
MTTNVRDEWVQYHQQSVDPQAEFVGSTTVTSMSSSNNIDQIAPTPPVIRTTPLSNQKKIKTIREQSHNHPQCQHHQLQSPGPAIDWLP